MAVDADTPVSAIEGIGPASAGALARIQVYTVFDLLRATTDQIQYAVGGSTSIKTAESWRGMAALLQVEEMTPQWAEALVRNEVRTVDALYRKSLPDVLALMDRALVERVIPVVPSAEQVSTMLKDAAVLTFSGSLAGTLRGPDKEPVRDATVRLGNARTQTDVRGRFRLLRIPLGATLELRIDHPEYKPLVVKHPALAADPALISVQSIRLQRRGHAVAAARLSELHGDVVPVPHGQPLRDKVVDVGELESGDVLRFLKFYEQASDAQLVSLFKTFDDGVVVIRLVRVSLARLGSHPRIGDHFRFDGQQFVATPMNATRMHLLKTVLRMEKELGGRPAGTPQQKAALAIEKLDYLLAHGLFAERGHS